MTYRVGGGKMLTASLGAALRRLGAHDAFEPSHLAQRGCAALQRMHEVAARAPSDAQRAQRGAHDRAADPRRHVLERTIERRAQLVLAQQHLQLVRKRRRDDVRAAAQSVAERGRRAQRMREREQKAVELGFDACGASPAQVSQHDAGRPSDRRERERGDEPRAVRRCCQQQEADPGLSARQDGAGQGRTLVAELVLEPRDVLARARCKLRARPDRSPACACARGEQQEYEPAEQPIGGHGLTPSGSRPCRINSSVNDGRKPVGAKMPSTRPDASRPV